MTTHGSKHKSLIREGYTEKRLINDQTFALVRCCEFTARLLVADLANSRTVRNIQSPRVRGDCIFFFI